MKTQAAARPRGLRAIVRRWTSSSQALVADELQVRAHEAGCGTIAESALRQSVLLRGRVSARTVRPVNENRWFEVELDDGTGTVRLVWIGRRTIPGIDVGREMMVRGRMTLAEGSRTIYNPHYELLT